MNKSRDYVIVSSLLQYEDLKILGLCLSTSFTTLSPVPSRNTKYIQCPRLALIITFYRLLSNYVHVHIVFVYISDLSFHASFQKYNCNGVEEAVIAILIGSAEGGKVERSEERSACS